MVNKYGQFFKTLAFIMRRWILIMLAAGMVSDLALAQDYIIHIADDSNTTKPAISSALPALPTVLVYNAEFARRLGLDPAKAITLDPALYAVALVVRRKSYLHVYGVHEIPYFWWKYANLNSDEDYEEGEAEGIDSQTAQSVFFQQLFPQQPRNSDYYNIQNYVINHDLAHLTGRQMGEVYVLDDEDSRCGQFMTQYDHQQFNRVLIVPDEINFQARRSAYYLYCGYDIEHSRPELKKEIDKQVEMTQEA